VASPHPTVAVGRPIRNARRIWFFAGYSWLFSAAMLVLGAATVVKWAGRGETLSALGGVAFFGALTAVPAWYGLRIWRAELLIAERTVIVRNPIRCHELPLDAIDAFRAGDATPRARNDTPGITVCLRGGHAIPVWALAEEASIFSAKQRTAAFIPLAEELNALLAGVGERGEPRSPPRATSS
jgi:hypothetical protein